MPFPEIAHVPRGESGLSKPPRTIEYRANCVVFSQRGMPVLGSGSRSSGDKTSAMKSPTLLDDVFVGPKGQLRADGTKLLKRKGAKHQIMKRFVQDVGYLCTDNVLKPLTSEVNA